MTPDQSLIDLVLGGRYRVIRQLGKGGMGTVYEAENTLIKRRVAVKVLDPAAAADEAFVRRFIQEAETVARLRHPNIVEVLDLGRDEHTGALFIVYELLVGRDLRKLLRAEGQLPAAEALAVIAPVMEALVVAHARAVVHRDLKPDNIFLAETPGGVAPKLIDFGIARVTSDDGVSLQNTHVGAALGTPYYMSPEHWRAEDAVDARADVWSLGVVLYEMLAGQRPFRGRNSGALIAKILYEAPTALAELAPDAPPALTDAVMRALQKDREARHPTMQAFLDAVRAASPEVPAAPALASSAAPRGPSAPATSGVSATFAPMEMPRTRGARGRSGLAALLALGLVALVSLSASGRPTTPARAAVQPRATLATPPVRPAPAPERRPSPTPPVVTPPAAAPSPVRRPPPVRRRVAPRAAPTLVTPSNGIEVL